MEFISKIVLCFWYGSLWVGRPGDRIPVGGRGPKFAHSSQLALERTQTSVYLLPKIYLGVKRSGRGVDQPPHLVPSLAVLEWTVPFVSLIKKIWALNLSPFSSTAAGYLACERRVSKKKEKKMFSANDGPMKATKYVGSLQCKNTQIKCYWDGRT